jgi:hypothetical protein
MANEITFIWTTGQTLTFAVFTSAGVQRETGTSMTETPASSGLYLGTPTTITTGDFVVIDDGTRKVGGGEYNPATILSSDGLDSVSTTEPSGLASNFREMLVQTWRRFFGKTTLSKTQILHYKANGTTIATTQNISETSTLQTQGEAS